MIRCKSEKPMKKLELDLTGPEGNAFVLLGYARMWGRQLGYSESKIKAIQDVMKLTNYDGLVHTLDQHFGEYVTFWR
ncbi:MAG: hypothetical protein CMF52_06825 [Legionellales bacterium]|nr:hypothetical protein [Legionellales bacterium]